MLREVLIIILLGLSSLIMIGCAVGIVVIDEVFDRLHFVGPIPLAVAGVALAITIREGLSVAGVKSLVVAVLIAVFYPVVTHAIARAARVRQYGHWIAMPEERTET